MFHIPFRKMSSYRVSDVHRGISALRMSQVILVIPLSESLDVVSIQLDTSPNPNNPLVESGHQY
jgi:hypothetical protein